MKRPIAGRALFYLRDSGGKHEMTPSQYVAWGQRKAGEIGVQFRGIPAAIDAMIREGRFAEGDLFLDYEVKGNTLSRRGLDALIKEALENERVTHIFIPRRDRLARPDDPLDGIRLENVLRRAGLTIVFLDRICDPIGKGRRQDIADMITALVDYDRAGKDRRDLAEKILFAQLSLAKRGFSTGGRPAFGFRRWLVKVDGTRVRQLADSERVKMAGHHVVWLPGPAVEIELIRRILVMLETMPAARVAATLTAEGIPSPDTGRFRKDKGILHPVSGVWHATTIVNIARNPLLIAVTAYGRRSMGDQLRYTAQGPREINDADFRPDNKPKVIRNPDRDHTTARAHGDPVADIECHHQLLAKLDARGASQRGKPRSRDPNNNPLGSRIFDMDCSWPLYRLPYNKSFRYLCGLYQQSHGEKCASNHVDGPTATRFMLSCIRQRVLPGAQVGKLAEKLRVIAAREQSSQKLEQSVASQRSVLARVAADLETAKQNMTLAQNPQQFQAMAAIFDSLMERQSKLRAELAEATATTTESNDMESEINSALALLQRLTELAAGAESLAAAGELFRMMNARLFLRFTAVQLNKRIVNRVAGGAVTFGTTPPPIAVYQGPTDRKYIKRNLTATDAANPVNGDVRHSGQSDTDREGKSIGNINRGDWI